MERTTSPDRKSNESVVEEQEESKVGCTTKTERVLSVFCNAIFIKAFVLTFVAEWGDRSQLSTVGLAVSTVSPINEPNSMIFPGISEILTHCFRTHSR